MALRLNAENLCKEFGIERIGFLTLTFPESVRDMAEASRMFNSLNTHLLGTFIEKAIVVPERHKSKGIHFHLLCALTANFGDIRSGFDFEAVRRRDYSSASDGLLRLWKMLRERLPEYGFGRHELMPIEKTAEAIASYVAKYIEKHLFNRVLEDKGKRLVRYIGFAKKHLKPNDFGLASKGATQWRLNARRLGSMVGIHEPTQAREHFGARWAYVLSQNMAFIPAADSKVECADLLQEFLFRDSALRGGFLREAFRDGLKESARERQRQKLNRQVAFEWDSTLEPQYGWN